MNRLKWLATIAQVVGVFMMSSHALPAQWAFGVMMVGSVAWSVAAAAGREWSALALNGAFCVSNLVGLWRWAS